jgi:hypothetical protein
MESPTTLGHSRRNLASSLALVCLVAATAHADSSQTLLTLTGEAAGDFFGGDVGTAGDVNGDGYADVIVGAYLNDGSGLETDIGRAYVYYGGPGADAVADLTMTGEAAGDYFGFSAGTAGDVNGDGYDDVIVGAYQSWPGGIRKAGRAYVYYGGPAADAVADLTLSGTGIDGYFGFSVGTAGDVNGDGYADLIVGAAGYYTGCCDVGAAYVYYGGATPNTVADLTLTGPPGFNNYALSVGTAGDVNGDGYADMIVGENLNDEGGLESGAAHVYYGGATPDAVADLKLLGVAGDRAGRTSRTAGDLNGDGYSDLIISAVGLGGPNPGRAYVFYGGAAPNTVADLTLTGEAGGDRFGSVVGTAGDVNGDGYADLIVGASLNDAGGVSAGRAYVFRAGPGIDAVADLTVTGASTGHQLGFAVGTAGDVNGDGKDDVIVGAPGAGQAYVISVVQTTTDVPLAGQPALRFRAPYPNPARDVVKLAFDLTRESLVTIAVFDLAGHLVARPIAAERIAAGTVTRAWRPQGLAPGVYVLRARVDGSVASRRMAWLGER